MANRDLIYDVWEGRIGSVEELDARVQVLRAPAWR
jgi:DNA-binding winged helix-turn-helix (wHTH) protein